LDIFVDRSSVEVFTENGSMVQTNLVFPGGIYNQLIIDGQPISGKVRELKSIW
jgi:fructan beta-fructosidase